MRLLGCTGCLFYVVAILVILGLALGAVLLASNVFATPETRPVPFTRNDGYAAQQRLYEIVLRQAGRSTRRDPLVITEPEANAFLARHLEQAGMPLSPFMVRFSPGQLTVQGQTALRNLFKGQPLSLLTPHVSDKWFDQRVWVTVRGKIRVEGTGKDRYGSVEVNEFALGRQPLGSLLLSAFLGPGGGGLLKWPVPSVVDEIRLDAQRVVVTTR